MLIEPDMRDRRRVRVLSLHVCGTASVAAGSAYTPVVELSDRLCGGPLLAFHMLLSKNGYEMLAFRVSKSSRSGSQKRTFLCPLSTTKSN